MNVPSTSALGPRAAAIGLGLAGVSLVASISLHPTILEGDVAHVVLHTDAWVLIHWLIAGTVLLSCWALRITVALHQHRVGVAGRVIAVVSTVGSAVMAAGMVLEALIFPAIARHAPELLDLDGPLLGSLALRAAGGLGAGYLIGLGALGVVLARSQVWGRLGWVLAASTVAFTGLAGMFVPVFGLLSSVGLAAAFAWWGRQLWVTAAEVSA